MHSSQSKFSEIIEKEIFSSAIKGKEGEELKSIQNKINLHRGRVRDCEINLTGGADKAISKTEEIVRDLGLDMMDSEIKSIINDALENMKVR